MRPSTCPHQLFGAKGGHMPLLQVASCSTSCAVCRSPTNELPQRRSCPESLPSSFQLVCFPFLTWTKSNCVLFYLNFSSVSEESGKGLGKSTNNRRKQNNKPLKSADFLQNFLKPGPAITAHGTLRPCSRPTRHSEPPNPNRRRRIDPNGEVLGDAEKRRRYDNQKAQ